MSRTSPRTAAAQRGTKSGPARQSAMPAMEHELKLQCPIELFEQIEPKIRSLTALINSTRNVQDKVELARGLMEQTGKLLRCGSFDESNMNCRLCRQFSTLRQQTAALIVKLAQTARPDEGGMQ